MGYSLCPVHFEVCPDDEEELRRDLEHSSRFPLPPMILLCIFPAGHGDPLRKGSLGPGLVRRGAGPPSKQKHIVPNLPPGGKLL